MIDPEYFHHHNWYKWPATWAVLLAGVSLLIAWAMGYPMPWEG